MKTKDAKIKDTELVDKIKEVIPKVEEKFIDVYVHRVESLKEYFNTQHNFFAQRSFLTPMKTDFNFDVSMEATKNPEVIKTTYGLYNSICRGYIAEYLMAIRMIGKSPEKIQVLTGEDAITTIITGLENIRKNEVNLLLGCIGSTYDAVAVGYLLGVADGRFSKESKRINILNEAPKGFLRGLGEDR